MIRDDKNHVQCWTWLLSYLQSLMPIRDLHEHIPRIWDGGSFQDVVCEANIDKYRQPHRTTSSNVTWGDE